jgi:6-phosphofructokinase 2
LSQGLELPNALRYGMAAGAAALLLPGTELSQASDVYRLLDKVSLQAV